MVINMYRVKEGINFYVQLQQTQPKVNKNDEMKSTENLFNLIVSKVKLSRDRPRWP
jgi:hypothetical protein